MKYNTLKQRLAIYKKILKAFEKEHKFGDYSSCYFGLCGYTIHYLNIVISKETLIELDTFITKAQEKRYSVYIDVPGYIPTRIILLKKVIKYTEKQILKHS